MKPMKASRFILSGLLVSAVLASTFEPVLRAQPAWGLAPPPSMSVPTTPQAQRNAMSNVQSQVRWLQNATQTASNFTSGGYGNVYQQFQMLCNLYTAFTNTLNAQQSSGGANQLAELSGGLNIIAEAFTNYQDDVANGRAPGAALNDMCQVLNEAAGVWLQEFNQDCSQLNVGWSM